MIFAEKKLKKKQTNKKKQWKYCWYLDFFIIFGILIAYVDSENSCFILILKEKNDKVLIFNNIHSSNFEKRVSLKLAPHLTVSKFDMCRGCLLEEYGIIKQLLESGKSIVMEVPHVLSMYYCMYNYYSQLSDCSFSN